MSTIQVPDKCVAGHLAHLNCCSTSAYQTEALPVVATWEVIGVWIYRHMFTFVKQVFLLFIISCQSLKNSSRGKKRPEPRGLLNQAKKETPPEKKTAVPAAGQRATCLLSGSHRLSDGTQVRASTSHIAPSSYILGKW